MRCVNWKVVWVVIWVFSVFVVEVVVGCGCICVWGCGVFWLCVERCDLVVDVIWFCVVWVGGWCSVMGFWWLGVVCFVYCWNDEVGCILVCCGWWW